MNAKEITEILLDIKEYSQIQDKEEILSVLYEWRFEVYQREYEKNGTTSLDESFPITSSILRKDFGKRLDRRHEELQAIRRSFVEINSCFLPSSVGNKVFEILDEYEKTLFYYEIEDKTISKKPTLRIKEILKEKGITAKELAEKLGKSPQYINGIINERDNVSITFLLVIAKTLGVPVSTLFFDYNYAKNDETQIICPNCNSTIKLKVQNKKKV